MWCVWWPNLCLCVYLLHRTVKIPDSADGLGFQIRGFGPSVGCMRLAEVRAKQRERKREKLGWAKGSYSCPLYPTVFLNLSWITAGAVGTWLDLSQIEKSITHTYISIYRENKLHSSRFLLCLQCILIRHGRDEWKKKNNPPCTVIPEENKRWKKNSPHFTANRSYLHPKYVIYKFKFCMNPINLIILLERYRSFEVWLFWWKLARMQKYVPSGWYIGWHLVFFNYR